MALRKASVHRRRPRGLTPVQDEQPVATRRWSRTSRRCPRGSGGRVSRGRRRRAPSPAGLDRTCHSRAMASTMDRPRPWSSVEVGWRTCGRSPLPSLTSMRTSPRTAHCSTTSVRVLLSGSGWACRMALVTSSVTTIRAFSMTVGEMLVLRRSSATRCRACGTLLTRRSARPSVHCWIGLTPVATTRPTARSLHRTHATRIQWCPLARLAKPPDSEPFATRSCPYVDESLPILRRRRRAPRSPCICMRTIDHQRVCLILAHRPSRPRGDQDVLIARICPTVTFPSVPKWRIDR